MLKKKKQNRKFILAISFFLVTKSVYLKIFFFFCNTCGLQKGRRAWQPTPVIFPGEFNGQRRLVGYSPWGRKELDMTERITLLFLQLVGS